MTGQLTGYEETSVVEVGAVLDTSPATAEEVYLRTIGHSERAIAAVAAKRADGGGSPPNNWCIAKTSNPSVDPLTDLADTARILTLTITSQAGSDFSVGEYPSAGRPAIISAAGGRFQFGIFVSQPAGTTLDAASNEPRFLYVPANCGDDGLNPLNSFGVDISFSFLRGNWGYSQLLAGIPGVASAGGPVFHGLIVELMNYVSGDSVPLAEWDGAQDNIAIWQVG